VADVRIVVGKRGFGKSWALRGMLRTEPRVVLYDTLKEKTYNEFSRIEGFPALCRFLATNPAIFRVAYSWDGTAPRELDFERVCEAVFCCRGLTFAVEEVDQYCNSSFLPRHLDMIVSLGRHRDLSVWVASRRPKEIHPLIRSQANQVVSFAQTEPADLEWSRQVIGDLSADLPGLKKYRSLTWKDGA